jgi:hypothetical protein
VEEEEEEEEEDDDDDGDVLPLTTHILLLRSQCAVSFNIHVCTVHF